MRLNYYQLKEYMQLCIDLGQHADKRVERPLVGAIVLSPDGNVVGQGFKSFIPNTRFLIHAERMALETAGENARGGTLVTTLEPCIRARPDQILRPCVELIVEAGIQTVVIGRDDHSELMKGEKGARYLRNRGVEVRGYYFMKHLIKEKLW